MNPRLIAWLSCAAAAAMVLGGCVQSNPRTINTPAPVITPMFASDAEALAAATDAYAAYVRVSDEITGEAGEGTQRIAPFVSKRQLKNEIKAFDYYSANSLSSQGHTKFDSVSLQSRVENLRGISLIVVYLCSDVAGISLLNVAGTAVTSTALATRYPLEVEFIATGKTADLFLIDRSESWQGKNFCLHS